MSTIIFTKLGTAATSASITLEMNDNGQILVNSDGTVIKIIDLPSKYYTKTEIDAMGIPLDEIKNLF